MLSGRFSTAGGSYGQPAARAQELIDPSCSGWTALQDPKAVHDPAYGKTYIVYADADGEDYIFSVDDATGATSTPLALHGSALGSADGDPDPHNSPAVEVLPDGRVLVAYSPHSGSTIYRRISTNPGDVTAFGSEASLDASIGGTAYTYAKLAYMSGDDFAFLFFRNVASGIGHLEFSISTDDGATWSARTRCFTPDATRAYNRMVSNGVDRLDIATTNKDPNPSVPASLYHFYWSASAFHDSDGTTLTQPITSSTATLIKAGSSGASVNAGGLAYDDDGNPVVLLLIQHATTMDVHQARWNGSAWVETTILDGNDAMYSNAWYPAVMSPDNPDLVWCGRKVGSFFEMSRFVSPDHGATWIEEVRTSGSAADHIQPGGVVNAHPALQVIWLYGDGGTAPRYNDGDLAIWGGY